MLPKHNLELLLDLPTCYKKTMIIEAKKQELNYNYTNRNQNNILLLLLLLLLLILLIIMTINRSVFMHS